VTDAGHPRDALLDLVYGELPADQALGVQRHVDGCAECAATVAGYRAVRSAAAGLRVDAPGAGLDSLLHDAGQAARRARRRRVLRWAGPVAAGAAAVLVVAIGMRPPAPARLGPLADSRPAERAGAKEAPEAEGGAGALLASAETKTAPAPSVAPAAPAPAKTSLRPSAKDAAREESVRNRTDRGPAAVAGAARPAPVSSELQPLDKRAAAEAAGRDLDAPARQDALVARKAAAPLAAAQARAEPAAASPVAGAAPAMTRSDDAVSGAVLGGNRTSPSRDGGVVATRPSDEARRAQLYAQLAGAKGAPALPLLAELCALEARLGHRADATRVCGQVVHDAPGTPEAAAAQRQLDLLAAP